MFDVIKEILITEKEFIKANYKRLQEALLYIKNNLIDADSDMYLTVNSLIEINIIKTDSNNITLKKVYVMPYGFDKIYIDKKLIADRLYQIIDQFNDEKLYLQILI